MSLHHHRLERIHAFCFVPISLFVSSVSTKLALPLWPLARLAQDEVLKNPDAPSVKREAEEGWDGDLDHRLSVAARFCQCRARFLNFVGLSMMGKLPTDERHSVLTSS